MKPSKKDVENFAAFIETLRKAQEEEESLADEEKKDNAVKMGDIYY